MSLSSLSIDQVLDIWTDLSDIWYTRITEENPNFGFSFYAYRILAMNPSISAMFRSQGSDASEWPESHLSSDIDIIHRAWGALRELLERFEKQMSTDDYSCEISINGRRVGAWMDTEIFEVWRCGLEISMVMEEEEDFEQYGKYYED